jgi:hypothetical protein
MLPVGSFAAAAEDRAAGPGFAGVKSETQLSVKVTLLKLAVTLSAAFMGIVVKAAVELATGSPVEVQFTKM